MADRVQKKLKKIIWLFACIFMLATGVAVIGMTAFGCHFMAVTTGSMEPEYPVGSLIITRRVSVDRINVGDVISYMAKNSDAVVTHRVSRVDAGGECFYTKGDANQDEDSLPVEYSRIMGKVFLKIPGLGYVFMVSGRGIGRVITVALLIAMLFVLVSMFIYDILEKRRRNHEEDMEKNVELDNQQ
jgi:signal peptidase